MTEPDAVLVTTPNQAPLVDVIIPVYRGLEETQRCLKSVLAFPQQTAHEIVVINDCSPELELAAYLRELAGTGAITLLVNPVNTGFVNVVNRGMVMHPGRDVVLLNSDTEVHGDWLDRLRRHATSDPTVGTVTPFSNNATICSYPRFCEDNLFIPNENRLAEWDTLFAEINTAHHIEIPTAVGFCMYITRHCIEQVGYFDAQRFGRGYGEENDFCLRSSELGFKHLLSADVFVYHQGSVSFGSERQLLIQGAMEQLRTLYPFYDQLIASHVAADPARWIRRRVDLVRLIKFGRPCLLFVAHQLGGGTEKHVRDLACLLEPQFEVLILRPDGEDKVTLEWARRGEEFKLYFSIPTNFQDLFRLLQQIKVVRVHFHHLIGHHTLMALLPQKLQVPYDYTLHDYFPICPQFNLTLSDGRYCGEPNIDGCNTCLKERPSQWRLDITAWRGYFLNFLVGAERVIGPSRDVIDRVKKYLPEVNFIYLPHPEPKIIKVLVLGMMSPAKGALQLESCARDAKKRNLPLSFRVLGCPYYEKLPISILGDSEPDLPLTFSGSYTDSDLSELILSEQADIIYFPAQWPETYSYTLSAALNSGLPIVAPKLGAFIERLIDYSNAYLIEWDSSCQTVNELLLDIMAWRKSTVENPKILFGTMNYAAYLEKYTVTINQDMSVAGKINHLTSNELIKAEYVYDELANSTIDNLGRSQLIESIKSLVKSSANRTLTWSEIEAWRDTLLEKQESLISQLADKEKVLADREQALAMLNQSLAEQCREFKQERQHTEALRQHLVNHEQIIQEIYSSTSWWLTRPVRWLGRHSWRWLRYCQRLRAACCRYYDLRRTRLWSFARKKNASFSSKALAGPAPTAPAPASIAGNATRPATVISTTALRRRVSVIIPTWNAGPQFADTLSQIGRQFGIDWLELLIIDSGSTDGTLELVRQTDARLIEISSASFGHASTRNQAAALADGDILVFMVQDAVPIAENWLYRLIEPLVADQADAASVRAIPRADADLHARWSAWSFDDYLGFTQDSLRCGLDYPDLDRLDPATRRKLAHLDNVCLAISRSLFDRFQFRGRYAEDLDLGLRLLQAGYRLLYQVDNGVIHSHSRPADYFLRREYINSLTLTDLLGQARGCYALTDVLPTLRWGYQIFCLLIDVRLPTTSLPLALRTLAGELCELFATPVTSSLPWIDLPLLALLAVHDDGTAPDPTLLAHLGDHLHWALSSLADYLDVSNSATSAEVAATLHQLYAVAAGALLAHSGVAPTPELVRGV